MSEGASGSTHPTPQKLERDLRAHLTQAEEGGGAGGVARQRAPLLTRADGVTGIVKIQGNHREAVKTWLKRVGF